MAKGRRNKPALIKALEGNPGKRALPKNFVAATGSAVCPDFLGPYAAETWGRICAAMPPGFYTGADVTILIAYCQAADALHEAMMDVAAQGHVVMMNSQTPVTNPSWRIATGAMAKLAALGSRLGLDPVARESIRMPEKPTTTSKFGALTGTPVPAPAPIPTSNWPEEMAANFKPQFTVAILKD